ncbi:hypothetical protein SAMN05519105_1020 [Rhodobacter sp. 24-YEA-8]|nr:hypothetical protein SAMN05519105_1020 [Rhodobacter sp. 24-YEA-8]
MLIPQAAGEGGTGGGARDHIAGSGNADATGAARPTLPRYRGGGKSPPRYGAWPACGFTGSNGRLSSRCANHTQRGRAARRCSDRPHRARPCGAGHDPWRDMQPVSRRKAIPTPAPAIAAGGLACREIPASPTPLAWSEIPPDPNMSPLGSVQSHRLMPLAGGTRDQASGPTMPDSRNSGRTHRGMDLAGRFTGTGPRAAPYLMTTAVTSLSHLSPPSSSRRNAGPREGSDRDLCAREAGAVPTAGQREPPEGGM